MKGTAWLRTVWAFDDIDGAEKAIETLKNLQQQQLITVQDAAIVTMGGREEEAQDAAAEQPRRRGALGGAFGMLFAPLPHPAARRGDQRLSGAIAGSMADVGIDDKFIDQVKQQVTPGTSALFVLTSDAVQDRVREGFKGTQGELIASNLDG